jgi:hypothetical protein
MPYYNLEDLQSRIYASSDDELIAMGSINFKSFVPEIQVLIKNEIEKRNLAHEIQKVGFDLFMNVNGFGGRLILLEEQLLFLSTGMKVKIGNSNLVLVQMMHEADRGSQAALSARLNFSGLDNQGSWICGLEEIHSCENKSSWFQGESLFIYVLDDEELQMKHTVFNDDLFKRNDTILKFEWIKLRIENEQNKYRTHMLRQNFGSIE